MKKFTVVMLVALVVMAAVSMFGGETASAQCIGQPDALVSRIDGSATTAKVEGREEIMRFCGDNEVDIVGSLAGEFVFVGGTGEKMAEFDRSTSRTTDRQCIVRIDIFCNSQWQNDGSVVRKVI